MNLEILSFDRALDFKPVGNTYGVRIFSTHKDNLVYSMTGLKQSEDWVEINNYYFDDVWPVGYEAFDYSNFNKAEEIFLKENFFGGVYDREIMFDEKMANKILADYEKVADEVDNVMIHCLKGENRSPAIGIAMNEIYGWGFYDLKKEFRFYRKYVYDKMIEVGRKK